MNAIIYIKNNYESLTSSEKIIADYILELDKEILFMSCREIANKTRTSPATVVRFSNKLGFKTFNEFKFKLTIDFNENIEKNFEFIHEGLTTIDIVNIIKKSYHNTINKTVELVERDQLDKAIELLKKANNIYIYGIGSSSLVAMDFYYKLTRINKRAIWHSDSHLQMTSAAVMEKSDVALAISYSGETTEILKCIEIANEIGAKTIAITRKAIDNKLANISQITLYIPTIEKKLREGAMTSRNSQLIITDILYIGMVKDDIVNTEEKLIKTRKIIDEFKKR